MSTGPSLVLLCSELIHLQVHRVIDLIICRRLESHLQGVSTRKVQDIISQLGVEDLSASSVSRISKELDAKVEEFLKRPLEHPFPYLFVDASYFKIRTEEHAQ